jgi:hypothetical protein
MNEAGFLSGRVGLRGLFPGLVNSATVFGVAQV